MAISREMTATEANVLNYIKNNATNGSPITAKQLRKKFTVAREHWKTSLKACV